MLQGLLFVWTVSGLCIPDLHVCSKPRPKASLHPFKLQHPLNTPSRWDSPTEKGIKS